MDFVRCISKIWKEIGKVAGCHVALVYCSSLGYEPSARVSCDAFASLMYLTNFEARLAFHFSC